jgi:hypothetical protein
LSPNARRPVACLCIALLALNVVACTHIKQEEARTALQPGGSVKAQNIAGVTLKDGREIRFDRNSRPDLRGDTLQAHVSRQPLAIAVTDVERVWVRSIDKTRTAILGIVAVTVIGMISSLASTDIGSF